ncbi:MAG: aminopeptidase [archaeon]
MDLIEKSILDALMVNMAYKPSERVIIITQRWTPGLGDKKIFSQTSATAGKMRDVFKREKIDSVLIDYIPSEARNGVDATDELYSKVDELGKADVIFMVTAYSLTHTPFRKSLTKTGARIASMPGFTLEMFSKGGPMSLDYNKVAKQTVMVASELRKSSRVRVTGKGTEMTVEIDNSLVFEGSGIIDKRGMYDNLPGAEAFAVPKHRGKTDGYFTVPKGWGGQQPIRCDAKFIVKDGAIVDVQAQDSKDQDYIDKEIKPLILGKPDHNVIAELGIGTNPNVTPQYIKKHGWSALLAEKIIGSAHFANGNSAAMGGKNNVPVHIDWVVPDVKIEYLRK